MILDPYTKKQPQFRALGFTGGGLVFINIKNM